MKILLIVLTILTFKFLLNLSRYLEMKKIISLYTSWLETNNLDFFKLNSKVNRIKELIKVSGTSAHTPYAQSIGLGTTAKYSTHIADLFPSRTLEIANLTFRVFYQTEETFRSRMIETFNPLYWVSSIVFLPKNLLKSFGVTSEGLTIKISQLLWWLLTPAAIIFRYNIYSFITSILSNF